MRRISPVAVFIVLVILSFSVSGQTNKPSANASIPSATPGPTPGAYPSGVKLNSIKVRDAIVAMTDENVFNNSNPSQNQVNESIQFMDGLGRPIQSIKRNFTFASNLINPIVYDQFGREVYKYLPYSGSSSDTSFQMNPFAAQYTFNAQQFPGEQVFYSKTVFERSPLNRVLKLFSPGNSWAGSDSSISEKCIQYKYLVNDGNDSVRIWRITSNALTYNNNDEATNIPSSTSFYTIGQLYKNITIDENGNTTVEYKDKSDKIILKKSQIGNISSDYGGYSGFLSIYYIYDELNQLRFVIPPKAVSVVKSTWTLTADIVNELCFRYEYDWKGRISAKKIPGAGWQYLIYDNRDRTVFSQDANLKLESKWTTTLYDQLNRPVITGITTFSGNPAELQTFVDTSTSTSSFISNDNTTHQDLFINVRDETIAEYTAQHQITFSGEFLSEDYADFTALILDSFGTQQTIISNNPLPTANNLVVLTITDYDDYQSTNKNVSSGTIHAKGSITVTKVRVLEDPVDLESGAFLETVSLYDDNGRVIEMQQDNYKGGVEITTTSFDFRGNPLEASIQHNNPAAGQSGIEGVSSIYAYDNMSRKGYNEHHPWNSNYGVLNYYTYNKLGQLINEDIGTKHEGDSYPYGSIETLNYDYNIRGWLKGINGGYVNGTDQNHFFGFDLNYNHGFEQNQFNGNISGIKWRSRGDNELRAYGFGYDQSNRLLFADFNQQFDSAWAKSDPSNSNYLIDFSVRMGNGIDPATAYDENGNIRGMKQWGLKLNSSSVIDNLVYNYKLGTNTHTNKLLNVIDSSNDTSTQLGDFRTSTLHSPSSKTSNTIDYTYDLSGNLKKDLNKDIGTSSVQGIEYNHLNLPYKITVQKQGGIKGYITYIYDANGNKLEKRVIDNTDSIQPNHNTTYIGHFIYENDSIQFFGQDHGRVRVKESIIDSTLVKQYHYDYFLKDHLGNIRMVLTDEMQQNVYPIASLENANSRNLEDNYYRINPANVVDSTAALAIPGYLNSNNISGNNIFIDEGANSQKLYRLNGSNNTDKMGLGITLKVMSGDIVDVFGKSYWKTAAGGVSGTPDPILLLDLLNDFIGNGIASKGGVTGSVLDNMTDITIGLGNFLDSQQQTSTKPKAYFNWILFDENFRPVISSAHTNSGFEQVGIEGELKTHYKSTGQISKNGYLYIYCSNESQLDVFFDNLQVVHYRGPLLEETHYYPFGLTMVGISSRSAGASESKQKFQGQELAHNEFSDGSGLEIYEFKYRMDDPQTGRFWQVDPLADKYVYNSTYAFSENHVTSHVELEGLESVPINPDQCSNCNTPIVINGQARSPDGNPSAKRKDPKTTGGFGLYRPKVTATFDAKAGAAGGIKGVGSASGGVGTTFIGIKDNEFQFAGKNLSTGEQTKVENLGVSLAGSGYEEEKVSVKGKDGKYEVVTESKSVRGLVIFTNETEVDKKSGDTTETLNINVGTSWGLGLIVNFEINWPLSKKVKEKK